MNGIIYDPMIFVNCPKNTYQKDSEIMPTTIVNYNEEIINFLEHVNYGMNKPQFNHLATIIEGIANIGDKASISKIAENIVKAKDKSCISRLLSNSTWDDELLNNNRLPI